MGKFLNFTQERSYRPKPRWRRSRTENGDGKTTYRIVSPRGRYITIEASVLSQMDLPVDFTNSEGKVCRLP